MKYYIKFALCISFIALCGLGVSCTERFEEINTDPTLITAEDVSARYFLTNPQVSIYSPGRFAYWRALLIYSDRYAGHFSFGFSQSFWGGELCYAPCEGYTNATWGYFSGNLSPILTYLNLTKKGGDFADPQMHAVGVILESLYYQMYTNTYGAIPYSEAGNPDIKLPDFDTQKAIYKGIIANLDTAMTNIGDAVRTGSGVKDLGNNDLFFDGNLQKWKRLANTLKLKMGLMALGSEGASFARPTIEEALSQPLLRQGENALVKKDPEVGEFGSSAYGNIWYSFVYGGTFKVSNTMIEILKETNDPRLSKYAQPAPGGKININRPSGTSQTLFQKRVNFILNLLDEGNVKYTKNVTNEKATITIPEDTYYVGSPLRMKSEMDPYTSRKLFSDPSDWVINTENPIFPEIVMTAAESFFLQATAAVKGFSGNAEELYRQGIREAMKLWNVTPSAISDYLANSPMAQLNGDKEDKLRKIAKQRWIASYTAGFNAWSIVRNTGYPKEIANGVKGEDRDIYSYVGVSGKFPKRIVYGSEVYTSNQQNLQEALQAQGPDTKLTNLWVFE